MSSENYGKGVKKWFSHVERGDAAVARTPGAKEGAVLGASAETKVKHY
jgi:hypothetical protein